MKKREDLNIFFNPKAVAVIGATERPGSWGSTVMQNLLSLKYGGNIYPVNVHADRIFGLPAFKDVREIPGPVNLAILTVPSKSVEGTIRACGQKQVRGIIVVTAGFSETSPQGSVKEKALVKLAHDLGIRVVGPNVSGLFDLHRHFLARGGRTSKFLPTPLATITQGGIAFTDILTSGLGRGMGVGKLVHTGNECDLTMTDFLEYFGQDPDVKAILLYIEGIRDSRRFIDIARKVTRKKPVVAYKGGRTPGSARASQSHTAALAGKRELWEALIRQVGIISSPTFELLLPLGHALVERPPMRGKRIGIVTVGGSWGVILSDFLEEAGLSVP
ncbi:MAG: CoA-binding protein [Deltaproteobacteria bacterium]|nr:CoA-binding protein [Deltaproteobacteria bacterium]